MHRQPAGSGFDGPGARTILGEPGPSTTAAQSPAVSDSPSPARGHHRPHDRGAHAPSHHAYRPGSSSLHYERSAPPPLAGSSVQVAPPPVIKRVGGKANVSSACGPCKRAHLACDVARPCKRCVNMGKEDQCEDVPHKKRGRPKVNKTPTTEPYPRPTRSADDGAKWKPAPKPYDPYGGGQITSSPPPLGALSGRLPSSPTRRASLGSVVGMSSLEAPPSYTMSTPLSLSSAPPGPMPDLFTLFCTTELKILRATSACHHLTGYHPHEFGNLPLLDWIHPSDRHLVDMERSRLVTVPYLSTQIQSTRETHAAVMNCGEHELMSPATGMREPYPNQNVRILRSDGSFALYNVRLHLGGGLGGSLWEPSTLGKVYLVISCLLISSHDPPSDVAARRVPHMPPTPVTPLAPAPPHSLPSFSSFAAAADAPPPPPQGGPPPPGSRPDSSYSPSSHYRQLGPPRRAQTPPYPPRAYASYPPPQSSSSYYPGPYDQRRGDGDWRRQLPPPPGPKQDHSRRAWEL